jgi:hypothetical protein
VTTGGFAAGGDGGVDAAGGDEDATATELATGVGGGALATADGVALGGGSLDTAADAAEAFALVPLTRRIPVTASARKSTPPSTMKGSGFFFGAGAGAASCQEGAEPRHALGSGVDAPSATVPAIARGLIPTSPPRQEAEAGGSSPTA